MNIREQRGKIGSRRHERKRAVMAAFWVAGSLFGQTAQRTPTLSRRFVKVSEVPISTVSTPRWGGQMIIQIENKESNSPILHLTKADGTGAETVFFSLPDKPYIQTLRCNAGYDRSIVVTGFALSDTHYGASFIALIPPDRKQQVVIRTAPFVPEAVAIARDGTIWSIGTLYDDANRRTIQDNVVQRFSASGSLLSSRVVAGLRSPADSPGDATQASKLVASSDRVGWFTSASQYVEFSLDGAETGRFDPPTGPDWEWRITQLGGGVAISDDDQVVLCTNGQSRKAFQVMTLDRNSRAWVPTVLGNNDKWQSLLGFDGTTLFTRPTPGVVARWERQDVQ